MAECSCSQDSSECDILALQQCFERLYSSPTPGSTSWGHQQSQHNSHRSPLPYYLFPLQVHLIYDIIYHIHSYSEFLYIHKCAVLINIPFSHTVYLDISLTKRVIMHAKRAPRFVSFAKFIQGLDNLNLRIPENLPRFFKLFGDRYFTFLTLKL